MPLGLVMELTQSAMASDQLHKLHDLLFRPLKAIADAGKHSWCA